MVQIPKNFKTAVKRFIDASDWLEDEHMPAVYSLLAIAQQLDDSEALSAALLAQYGVTFRNLYALRPYDTAETDPLQDALNAVTKAN